MPKQSRLAEDAVIYQPRQELTEKEKLSDMSLSKKLSYLWEYYKVHALVTVSVIAISGYIIYQIATPNIEPQFNAAFINNTIATEVLDQYKADFADYLQLDPKTQSVEFNASFYLNSGDEYSMNMQQVLSTYIAAGEIDVIIAPKTQFESYAYYGYMDKLPDQLPTDIYSSLTDYVYVSTTEEDAQKNVYGIYLTETDLFRENANNADPYILGIIVNSGHKVNAVEFIRTLFNE